MSPRLIVAALFVVCASASVPAYGQRFYEPEAIHIDEPKPLSSLPWLVEISGYAWDVRPIVPHQIEGFDSGIDMLHAWLHDPSTWQPRLYLGPIRGGDARWPYPSAGFKRIFIVPVPGVYHLAVYTHSAVSNEFRNVAVVPWITIRDCRIVTQLDDVSIPGGEHRPVIVPSCQ